MYFPLDQNVFLMKESTDIMYTWYRAVVNLKRTAETRKITAVQVL
jgi:hypothetical protein